MRVRSSAACCRCRLPLPPAPPAAAAACRSRAGWLLVHALHHSSLVLLRAGSMRPAPHCAVLPPPAEAGACALAHGSSSRHPSPCLPPRRSGLHVHQPAQHGEPAEAADGQEVQRPARAGRPRGLPLLRHRRTKRRVPLQREPWRGGQPGSRWWVGLALAAAAAAGCRGRDVRPQPAASTLSTTPQPATYQPPNPHPPNHPHRWSTWASPRSSRASS